MTEDLYGSIDLRRKLSSITGQNVTNAGTTGPAGGARTTNVGGFIGGMVPGVGGVATLEVGRAIGRARAARSGTAKSAIKLTPRMAFGVADDTVIFFSSAIGRLRDLVSWGWREVFRIALSDIAAVEVERRTLYIRWAIQTSDGPPIELESRRLGVHRHNDSAIEGLQRAVSAIRTPAASAQPPQIDAVAQIASLAKLRESGSITEEEYEEQKEKLLRRI